MAPSAHKLCCDSAKPDDRRAGYFVIQRLESITPAFTDRYFRKEEARL
jgi:hypothetical protein